MTIYSSLKNNLYASALLQHIPHEKVQARFQELVASDKALFDHILSLADQYALTRAGSMQHAAAFPFLSSPFENLKSNTGKYNYKIPALPLSLEDALFPQKDTRTEAGNIQTRWNEFGAAMEQLEWTAQNLKRTAETALSLLFKYASAIPNPSNLHREVAWYDYAKMKAGLAVCIYDYLQDEKKDTAYQIQDKDKPILLIRADLSGIQKFILDIASKQASKNLKGRSFYIQLLGDTVLQLLLKAFSLYNGNVMYASGGNFFLLAPNTAKVREAYEEWEHRITKAIFKEHGTRISVVMGCQKVSQKKILDGKIKKAIRKLFEDKIDRNKKRKFASLIKESYGAFFEPSDEGGESDTDAISGEEIFDDERIYQLIEEEPYPVLVDNDIAQEIESEKKIKENTAKQIFIGGHLKEINYIVESAEPLSDDPEFREHFEIEVLQELQNSFYSFIPDKRKNLLTKNKRIESIKVINNFNASGQFEFLLYGGNKAPTFACDFFDEDENKTYRNGTTKTFNQLSFSIDADCKSIGRFKRIAILKMDVDGLGNIFKDIKRKNLTFAYYAALSRSLDWFFKGYLNTLWESNSDYKEYTQIIYSGGDDLFIIGKWDVIIDFAEAIQKEFHRFTCSDSLEQEDCVTISGGIAIVTDKFPIIKAATFADSAEKAAKGHELNLSEQEKIQLPDAKEFKKNSITILGVPLHWDSEFALVKELKEELVRYISFKEDAKYGLPFSMLSKIKIHYQMMMQYERAKNQNKKVNPAWTWNIVYDFSRFKERQRKEIQEFVTKLKGELEYDIKQYLKFLDKIQQGIFINSYERENGVVFKIESRYHFLELLHLAARWAELEIRSKRK